MKNEFSHKDVWKRFTAAANSAKRPAAVAVAYFGKGAAKQLPLPTGSRLFVNASEAAVKSGQTHPYDLIKLQAKGVRIFSVPNLHAKVFLFGSRAFVGSTNVSKNSANTLPEAMLVTNDRGIVAKIRNFIEYLPGQELGPTVIDELQSIYRPPRIPGGKRGNTKNGEERNLPELPRLHLVQLEYSEPPKESVSTQAAGRAIASRKMKRPQYKLDDFHWEGKGRFQSKDVVIQITDEEGGAMVSPLGNVLHIKRWRHGSKLVTFVYLELPSRNRVLKQRLAKRLGRGFNKHLSADGLVKDRGTKS